MGLVTFSPFFITGILDATTSVETLIDFNYALRWYYLVSIPLLSITMLGTIDMSESSPTVKLVMKKYDDLWRPMVSSATILSFGPSIFLMGMAYLLPTAIGLPLSTHPSIFSLYMACSIIGCFTLPMAAASRAIERPGIGGYSEILVTYFLKIPILLTVLLNVDSNPNQASAVVAGVFVGIEVLRVPIFRYMLKIAERQMTV